MDAQSTWTRTWIAVAAAVGLIFLPRAASDRLRTLVADLLAPGQSAAAACADRFDRWTAQWQASARAAETVAELQARVAELEDQLRRSELLRAAAPAVPPAAASAMNAAGESSPPLFVPALVEARLIGSEVARYWAARRLLSAGTGRGVADELFVLGGQNPLLDQGASAGVQSGDAVFTGRAIVGRIARTGRWTSTLRLVTDPEYRGAAQLFRRKTERYEPGPLGSLRGDGTAACRLTLIPTTEVVSVGDLVVSVSGDGILPEPLVYGTVTSVQPAAGGTDWEIQVQPAFDLASLRTTWILRTELHPRRVLAD